MTVLCVIGARGGSQGLPNKNIRPMLGKPLIVWSIEQALATPEIDRLIVSTDSLEIARIAKTAGAEVPFIRPESLAGSDTGKFQVWTHAFFECEKRYGERYECMIDLDCTSPLRESTDISKALAQFRKGRSRNVSAVFSICNARKNPYFNLVEPDADGALRLSKPLTQKVLCRQKSPPVFEHVASIYVLDAGFLGWGNHLLDGHAEGYDIGQEKSLDVDCELDFLLVEFLLNRRLNHSSTPEDQL